MKIERSSMPYFFFSRKEKEAICAAIREAEKSTSGEIRVHLERKADQNIVEHAARVFEKIGMTKTELRNGVLIFIGVKTKRFAILGDSGINEKVGEDFWSEEAKIMEAHFKEDRFADGICAAVIRVAEKLSLYFPHQRNDVNELPDSISYSL